MYGLSIPRGLIDACAPNLTLSDMSKTLRTMLRMTGPESSTAAIIFLVLVFAPLPLIALPLAVRAADWRSSVGLILTVGVLTALVFASGRVGLKGRRGARTLLPVSYAMMWSAALQGFLGACVLVTGTLPSRRGPEQVVPRSYSMIYFAIAAGFGIISLAGFLLEVSRQRRRA